MCHHVFDLLLFNEGYSLGQFKKELLIIKNEKYTKFDYLKTF